MTENREHIFDLSEFDSANDFKALIELENIEKNTNEFNSSRFIERENLLKDLFNSDENKFLERIQIEELAEKVNKPYELTPAISVDKVIISGWKIIENISARLIENSVEHLVLECLIDKEAEIYEERIFRKSLFSGYDLEFGNLFYLRFFEGNNVMKMEVHDGKGIVSINDFPEINFAERFRKSKLFNK